MYAPCLKIIIYYDYDYEYDYDYDYDYDYGYYQVFMVIKFTG